MNGRSSLLSGVLGGLVVAVVGAVLLATGAVDTGKTTTVLQRQAPLAAGSGSHSNAASETGGPLTVGDIYKRAAPGVAFIQATITETTPSPLGFPQQQRGQATGSGFVLNQQGYIATNAHVVAGAKNAQVSFGKGAPTPAKIVGADPSTDLAVIKVDPSKVKQLTTVPLGDSNKLQVGDPVVAIGNPFGLDDTVTTGVVSALGREIKAPNEFSIDHTIQTDAAINPGNSGGPLLDDQGRVVGINAQIATGGSGKGSVGIGFAIPINLAKSVFPQLIKTGKVPHAYVGVTTAPVTAALAKALKLPVSNGALVQAVQTGSPADKAGLIAGKTQTAGGVIGGGDLIVAVDGKTVTTPSDIATAISDNKPGDTITVSYYRGQAKRTATLTLANRPAKAPSSSLTPGGP